MFQDPLVSRFYCWLSIVYRIWKRFLHDDNMQIYAMQTYGLWNAVFWDTIVWVSGNSDEGSSLKKYNLRMTL